MSFEAASSASPVQPLPRDSVAVKVDGLGKCYQIYDRPGDRLKQFLAPRLQRVIGRQPKPYFTEFWALRGVDFTISRGETVGIIGRNGSGKSTLLQMICGTLTPTEGSVETFGRVAALLELGSGFNPEFTGRENVFLNASVLGQDHGQTEQCFARIAEFADIGDFLEQPVKTYSSGMLMRLAFAVIAHVDADLLVVDEALSVGDAYFTQKCMRFLREFMKTGTVVFVSHDAGAVQSLCDRAIWLNQGKMVAQGAAKGVCEQYLQDLFNTKGGGARSIAPGLRQVAQVATTEVAKVVGNTPALTIDFAASPASKVESSPSCDSNHQSGNRMRPMAFDFAAESSGAGGARIVDVRLFDAIGQALAFFHGGEIISLQIRAITEQEIFSPIVGFYFKDRLGQYLFGANTHPKYQASPIQAIVGQQLTASFTFQVPHLPRGQYSISAAIASGGQDNHIMHQWMHDALVVESLSSHLTMGLVGIPMKEVLLRSSNPEQ